jgi:hypothetical protein
MRLEFIERDEGGLVAEVEIYFETDLPKPFAGKKIVGTQVRRSRDGNLYVNLPGRAFGAGGKRQYFDYLRDEDENHESLDDVKKYILEEYRVSEPFTEE